MFEVRTAADGSSWLMVDTVFSARVHPSAQVSNELVKNQSANDKSAITGVVEGAKGQRLSVWSALPQIFKHSKTYSEMVQAGLIVPPLVP